MGAGKWVNFRGDFGVTARPIASYIVERKPTHNSPMLFALHITRLRQHRAYVVQKFLNFGGYMARFFEINGVKFNSVKYDGREWVLASEVAPYIKVKNLTVAQQPLDLQEAIEDLAYFIIKNGTEVEFCAWEVIRAKLAEALKPSQLKAEIAALVRDFEHNWSGSDLYPLIQKSGLDKLRQLSNAI
jgi:hypothetical protein